MFSIDFTGQTKKFIYLMINIASIIALKLAMTAVYRIISLPIDIKINYEILVLSP